ncbi:MAG: hypothetical protein AAF481_04765 [Acidobacteriota bacterium]
MTTPNSHIGGSAVRATALCQLATDAGREALADAAERLFAAALELPETLSFQPSARETLAAVVEDLRTADDNLRNLPARTGEAHGPALRAAGQLASILIRQVVGRLSDLLDDTDEGPHGPKHGPAPLWGPKSKEGT